MKTKLIILAIALILLNCNDSKSTLREYSENTIQNNSEHLFTINDNMKNVEIVFCLDATGSMSGLISTAKEKIWDIVSELAQSNDVETLKLGMIFYRDRGDIFVTKTIELTEDLDDVYSKLLEINADGGGDTPESVNQALYESVNKISWSDNDNTYRTIFVVGDCPPHMDYKNDIPYTKSCQKAHEKGITINTIKLGTSCLDAIPHFKNMAKCSNGDFLHLDQDASDLVIETPYDKEINELSKKIDESRLYYGTQQDQRINNEKKEKSIELYDKSSFSANSARASYNTSKSGQKSWMGSKELIEDYKNGKVKLEEIKENELPPNLKGKTLEEKENIIKQQVVERDNNIDQLIELSKKRKIFIDQELEKTEDKDTLSFSKEVVKILKNQAK